MDRRDIILQNKSGLMRNLLT